MTEANEISQDIETMYHAWPIGSIWDLFCNAVERFPENEFLVFENGKRYTYKRAYEICNVFIDRLANLGVEAGTHVGLKLRTCPELVFIGLALNAIGAVRVSLNESLGPIELSYETTQAEVNILITDTAPRFARQLFPASFEKLIVITDQDNADLATLGLLPCEVVAFNQGEAKQLNSNQHTFESVSVKPLNDDYALSDIIFTSGGSGQPKAVPLTNDMLLRSAYASCLTRNFEIGRRIFLPLPQCHVYAYVEGLLTALFVGGCLLMVTHNLPPKDALDYIRNERANDIIIVPSIVVKYLDYLKVNPMEFPDLGHIYCSASTTPSWIWDSLAKEFDVEDVITGYGMTEVSGATLQTRAGDDLEVLRTRVGILQDAGNAGSEELGGNLVEYRVIDQDTGLDCAAGEYGELWCRGPVVLREYYNDERNTEKSFFEGWFKTGDIGRFDENGYLELKGKTSDSYKINGENVSTSFVESIAQQCEQVYHVEIIGVPDERLGAVGAAFIQLKEDSVKGRDEFERHCRENLARHQVPKYYFYFSEDDWPLTPSGKVKKKDLHIYASLHQ